MRNSQAVALQAYRGDCAALAATILARQLESQQLVGPALPVKALLDHSPPRGHHDRDSPSLAAAPEAELGFPAELSTEVVWRPACDHVSETSRVASEEKQQQSWAERKDGEPQLQVGSGRWQGHLSASAVQHQQWEDASESRQPTESEAAQDLSLATSSHLLDFTQVESEFHGNMEADSSHVHDVMLTADHHSCSRQSSPDHTQPLSEQAHREAMPTQKSRSSALISQDDQQLEVRSQFLQDLDHQEKNRDVSSAGSRPQSGNRQQADHVNVIPASKAQPGRLLSPKQQASTAGNTALDQPSTGCAIQKHDDSQHAGTQACEVVLHGQQTLESSSAAWATTLEHLGSKVHSVPAQHFPADSGAGDSQLQALTAGDVLFTLPEYPADPKAPSFRPDREGPLLGATPRSPSRQRPLLGAAPHSPDRAQPLLGRAPHSPDRGSDAQASAGNSPAGARKCSRPKASQPAARALREGLLQPTAMAQGMSSGVHSRLGS